ncbi:unnamed protein product [Rhizophagus irregularis]|nr:unnamed protein product [Rhizophagus irregularis]
MVYSKGDQKGEILSPHLQIKAVEFQESSTQEMEDKIKELEKENLQLKNLSMQVVQAKKEKRHISKI